LAVVCCGKTQFTHIQAIIFDKDGTLADAQVYLSKLSYARSQLIEAHIPTIQNDLLVTYGVKADRVNPAGLMAVGTRQENVIATAAHVTAAGRDWLDSLNLVQDAFAQADAQMPPKAAATPLFAGAYKILYALNQAQVLVGILSSDTTQNVREFVEHYQLEALVQLQLGTDTNLSKPNPALLHHACQRLNVLPSQTLMVGDSKADIQMARSAKVASVGVTWGWGRTLDLGHPDALIHDWTEIILS
jgi:phosphoglycolate phosphatase